MGNGEENNMLYQQFLSLSGHHSISGGGGGAEVFVVGKLFISTRLGGALIFFKISHVYHVYIEHIK